MISVCVATYNGEKYIKEQLLSILSQIGLNDEVVVSDDHSNDSTIDIVKSLNDKRVKIIYNEGNRGYTSNFENALKHAKGDYVFISDQDDIWSKYKVDVCMQYFNKYDFIVSNAFIVDGNGTLINDSFFECRKPYKSFLGNIYKFGYLGCCMAFKKEVIRKAIPFPVNRKMCTHDNWLLLVGKMFYKVKILDEQLIYYRRHSNNVSDGGFGNRTTLFFKMKYRLYLLYNLIKRILK